MGAFLSYSILSGILMLTMYLTYRLFLAGENQHNFNRSILLLIYFVSFSCIPISGLIEMLKSSYSATIYPVTQVDIIGADITSFSAPIWGTLLIWVYICGIIVVTLKTVVTWTRLTNVIRSGRKIPLDGYTLVITNDDRFAPFSWMRYVVIGMNDYINNYQAITTHELKHVSSRHWIDLLIAQIVCIINWFNPVAWLMREELMLVHEYQADTAVINDSHNVQEYQMLLIKKAVGSRFPSLANSLNHSKLKKRITMMYKEKSGAGRKFKALALVPVLALALGVSSIPAVRAAVSTISSSEISRNKVSENPANGEKNVGSFRVTGINDNGDNTSVTISGTDLGSSLSVSGGSLAIDGRTVNAKSMESEMTDGTATITVIFPISCNAENSIMTLNIDGSDVNFNLGDFYSNAQNIKVRKENGDKSAHVTVTNGEDVTIYFNGQKITREQLNAISPADIASITVDKEKDVIIITGK